MTAAILPQAACIPIMQLHATTATPVPQAILAQQAFAWGRPFLAATVQTSRSAILPAELMQNAQLQTNAPALDIGQVPLAIYARMVGPVLTAASRHAILPAELMQNARLQTNAPASDTGRVSLAIHAPMVGPVMTAASQYAILSAELMQNVQLRIFVPANRDGRVPHAAQMSMNANLVHAAQTQRATIRKAAIPAFASRDITIAMATRKMVVNQ
jgi:hypothetical protein